MSFDPIKAFWDKVEITPSCWIWHGATDSGGYGRLTRKGVNFSSHRYAYEFLIGPIPSGLLLDHLCRVRLCVNPIHLEPVTRKVNNRRGLAIGKTHHNGVKESCPQGHAYDESNTRLYRGYRYCKACERMRSHNKRHPMTSTG